MIINKRTKRKRIMNKKSLIALLCIVLLFSCRPGDKQTKLERMEKQRDALDKKIVELKAELAGETGPNPPEEKAIYVGIQQVQPSLFQHFIKVQGTVESDNNILIPAQASGVVKKIYVNQGDRVSQGQLLAELDGAILESSIAEVETGMQLATTVFERQERLWNKNIGSEIEFLQAKNNKESLEKRLATLQEQLKMTKVISPIEGRVDDIMIKEGEMAAAGRGTVRIVQLTRLKVAAALAENYISQVRKNDVARVEIPFLGVEFEHKIDAVSQVIDPDNRTFQIEIKVPGDQKDLKPNLLAVITINDYTNPQALTVLQNIVQETGAEQFLFVAVQKDGQWRAERRAVKTGEDYRDRVEIMEGLSQGEYVVTVGFQDLADGQPIVVDNKD
jgi:membrane fusion protein (multidrug efflux system)